MYTKFQSRQIQHDQSAEDEIKMEECETCQRLFCRSDLRRHKKFANCRPKVTVTSAEMPVVESTVIQPEKETETVVNSLNKINEETMPFVQTAMGVSEEQPYICKVCKIGFKWSSGLRRHLKGMNGKWDYCPSLRQEPKQVQEESNDILNIPESTSEGNITPEPTTSVNNNTTKVTSVVTMGTTTHSKLRASDRLKRRRLVFTPSTSPTRKNLKLHQPEEQINSSTTSSTALCSHPPPKGDIGKAKRRLFTDQFSSVPKEGKDRDNNLPCNDENNTDSFDKSPSSFSNSVVCSDKIITDSSSADTTGNNEQQEPVYPVIELLPVVPVEVLIEQQRLNELCKFISEENRKYRNAQWNSSFFLHMNRYQVETNE